MTEREAAVRWLGKDYDHDLELIIGEFEGEGWGESIYYWARVRRTYNRPFFTVKDQNG